MEARVAGGCGLSGYFGVPFPPGGQQVCIHQVLTLFEFAMMEDRMDLVQELVAAGAGFRHSVSWSNRPKSLLPPSWSARQPRWMTDDDGGTWSPSLLDTAVDTSIICCLQHELRADASRKGLPLVQLAGRRLGIIERILALQAHLPNCASPTRHRAC